MDNLNHVVSQVTFAPLSFFHIQFYPQKHCINPHFQNTNTSTTLYCIVSTPASFFSPHLSLFLLFIHISVGIWMQQNVHLLTKGLYFSYCVEISKIGRRFDYFPSGSSLLLWSELSIFFMHEIWLWYFTECQFLLLVYIMLSRHMAVWLRVDWVQQLWKPCSLKSIKSNLYDRCLLSQNLTLIAHFLCIYSTVYHWNHPHPAVFPTNDITEGLFQCVVAREQRYTSSNIIIDHQLPLECLRLVSEQEWNLKRTDKGYHSYYRSRIAEKGRESQCLSQPLCHLSAIIF